MQLLEAQQELARRLVLRDFRLWLPQWHFVDEETGEVRTFAKLWAGQEAFLETMLAHPWVFALKAGKLGFTELECAFDGFRAMSQSNARVHIFSRVGTAAQENLDKVRFGLLRLPERVRPRLLAEERGGDTGERIKWRMGPNDVRTIVSYTAAPDASIERTAIHAHVDELARMSFPEQTWQAINSTVAPEGTCHIVTRGAGEDNYTKELWDAAEAGVGRLYPFFQPWTARPGRTQSWYEDQAGNMTRQGLKFFAPDTPEDALGGEDTMPFVPMELWDACLDPALPPFLPNIVGKIPVVIAADAASTGDCFGVVAITRHPDRHDDVVLRAARKWDPPGRGREIDFTEPESFMRALVLGGCAAGHSQEPQFAHLHAACDACKNKILVPPYNVVEITYDPYQLTDMMQRVNRDLGIWTIPFDQTKLRLIADRRLYDLIVHKGISHPGIDIVREHMLNARAKLQAGEDSKLRIVKKAAAKKIDLVVATSMGVHECLELLL